MYHGEANHFSIGSTLEYWQQVMVAITKRVPSLEGLGMEQI